jgi:hypothetical protein
MISAADMFHQSERIWPLTFMNPITASSAPIGDASRPRLPRTSAGAASRPRPMAMLA